jgi:hypothetical protein
MIKLFNRWKEFRAWEADNKLVSNSMKPVLSMELGDYSYEECLIAVSRSGLPMGYFGIAASFLYARTQRGRDTLKSAISAIKRGTNGHN